MIRPRNVVRLPKGSISPTGSIYKRYDIVSQGRVLSTYVGAENMVYSSAPFVLSYSVNGKVREVRSTIREAK